MNVTMVVKLNLKGGYIMSKSQAIAFFEEISKNQQLAQAVEKVIGEKTSDKAKSKELISLAKHHGFNFTQEEAASVGGALKVSLSQKDMLEVSGGDGFKSSVMAMALLACLGGSVSTLPNIVTSAMKPNHQQASPQTQTEFMKDLGTARFDPHYTTTYFDDNPTYFGDNSAYFGNNSTYLGDNSAYSGDNSTYFGDNSACFSDDSAYFDERSVILPAPSLYDEQLPDGTEHASEMSFDEDFEENNEMESPSELNLAPEATQEQSQSVPYVFLNYHGNQLYMGDISDTLDAYGATARIAALWDGINCTLKLYGPEWGLGDYPFVLNFDVSEGAVHRGTGLLIVGPGNVGLRIHFRVQESSFRNRILLWFEKVEGEVNVPDNWGILSIDSSSYSAPQLSVMNFGDIRFTTDEDFEME